MTPTRMWYQTVAEAERLIRKYGLDECLIKAKELIDNTDNIRKQLSHEEVETCSYEIFEYALSYCGIGQLYAALLFCSGNQLGADLQYRAYQFSAAQAIENIGKLLNDEPPVES